MCLLGLLYFENAKAQVTVTAVSFNSSPDNCSETFVYITETHYCSNYVFLGSNVTVSGSNITVSVSYTSGFVCLPAIVTHYDTISLGTLASGTYSVTVQGYLNSSLSSTSANNNLTVVNCCSAVATFSFSDDTICPGDSVLFTSLSTGQNSDEWLMDGTSVSTASSMTLGFATPGTYAISLVAASDSCSDTTSRNIYVSALPDADLGHDTVICEGQPATFGVAGGQGTYLWSDGYTGATNVLSTVGSLSLTVTNDLGCEAADTVSVTAVNPAAEPDLGNDMEKCPGLPLNLDAGAGWTTVQWSTGATSEDIDVNIPGTYWVEVTGANGCPGRDSISITDYSIVLLSVSHDPDLCGHATLYTDDPYNGYSWSTLDVSDTVTVLASGTYTVTVVDGNECSQSDSITVEVLDVPAVNLGNDTFICGGQTIALTSNVNGTYLWNTGSTMPMLVVTQVGTYWLQVTSDEGCAGHDSIVVDVCAGVDALQKEWSIYPVPARDYLIIQSSGSLSEAEMRLFNMEGMLVRSGQLNGTQVRIGLEGLPAGQYLLQVIEPVGVHTQRISILR